MHGLSAETCFVPIETHDGLEETRKTAEKYNFMTEIFFMAHKAIDLSFRGIVQQLIEINQVRKHKVNTNSKTGQKHHFKGKNCTHNFSMCRLETDGIFRMEDLKMVLEKKNKNCFF